MEDESMSKMNVLALGLLGISVIPMIPIGRLLAEEQKGGAMTKWTFESDEADKPPKGFSFGRTGKGAQGKWIVRAEKDAPSGKMVLAQADTDDTDYRFPVAAADKP